MNLPCVPSLFQFEWERGHQMRCWITQWLRFPWPKVIGSLNHEVKGEFGWCGEQTKEALTFPLPRRLDTINIDRWEEEGGASSSGRGVRRRNCICVTSKHQEVSFGWVTMQTKQNTHLPLLAVAPYDRYRSGRGRAGSPPQFWEDRSAEEQQTPSRQTSRGEFRVRWQAMQTKYSPSPHLLCSL